MNIDSTYNDLVFIFDRLNYTDKYKRIDENISYVIEGCIILNNNLKYFSRYIENFYNKEFPDFDYIHIYQYGKHEFIESFELVWKHLSIGGVVDDLLHDVQNDKNKEYEYMLCNFCIQYAKFLHELLLKYINQYDEMLNMVLDDDYYDEVVYGKKSVENVDMHDYSTIIAFLVLLDWNVTKDFDASYIKNWTPVRQLNDLED